MAISKLEVGVVPLGVGGDSLRSAAAKINENFSNTTHAANRLVGGAIGNIPDVKEDGLGSSGYMGVMRKVNNAENADALKTGFYYIEPSAITANDGAKNRFCMHVAFTSAGGNSRGFRLLNIPYTSILLVQTAGSDGVWKDPVLIYSQDNVTKDANGFLKGKSPVTRLFSDRLEHQGEDKELQGIEFKRLGVGDYLLKNTTGLSNDGWYIELPQDANKNPLVAVEYEDLGNGEIILKTYKRTFDMNTFMFAPDKNNPMDIPETRWIDLRFNEFPQEHLHDIQTEV